MISRLDFSRTEYCIGRKILTIHIDSFFRDCIKAYWEHQELEGAHAGR